jgi:hypothetical protein
VKGGGGGEEEKSEAAGVLPEPPDEEVPLIENRKPALHCYRSSLHHIVTAPPSLPPQHLR